MDFSSYYLKRDELDFNYFMEDDAQGGSTKLLWDLTAKNRTEYLEFKIMAQRKTDDSSPLKLEHQNDTNTLSTPHYKCLMCNIEVPTMYKDAHNSSPKHKISLKIAETALDRIKNHISASKDDGVVEIPDVFFCESCSIAVKDINRNEHESSELHRKSVLHDRLFKDLQMIYEDYTSLNTIDFGYLIEDSSSIEDDSSYVHSEVSSHEISKRADDESDIFNIEPRNGLGNKNKVNRKADINNYVWNEDKIRACAKILSDDTSHPTHKFSFAGPDLIRIETVDKTPLEVSFDNFNGFSSVKEKPKYVQCKICRLVFVGSRDEHIYSKEHFEKVKIPLENKHCYRQVDKRFKHCVLCNDNFFDIDYHKTSETHKAALVKAMNFGSMASTHASPNPSHAQASSKVYSNNTSSSPAKQKVSIKGKTYCQYCRVHIDSHNFASHTSGSRHQAQMMLEQLDNTQKTEAPTSESQASSSKLPSNATLSSTVKQNAPLKSKTYHNTQKIEAPISKSQASSSKLPSNATSSSTAKQNALVELLFCQSCNVLIDSHSFASHVAKSRHCHSEALLKQLYDIQKNEQPASTLHYHFLSLANVQHVLCIICLANVPNNPRNIKEHVKGGTHGINYEKFLKFHDIKTIGDQLFCERCSANIDVKKEIVHVYNKH